MAVSIQIADVVSQVQFRLHLPAVGTGSFVTSSAALLLAKSSVSRLGAVLNRLFGDSYFAQTATLATQANVDLVSLPTGFGDLLSLHWVNGDRAVPMERASIMDFDPLPRAWSANIAPKYRVEGSVVVLTPAPSQVYTIRCAYTTGLSIAALTDTIQAPRGCDEWLIADMCAMIRMREDKDASGYLALRKDAEADIQSQAANRDRNGVVAVRDTTSTLDNNRCLYNDRSMFFLDAL